MRSRFCRVATAGAGAVLGILALLGGCGLPRSGPVQQGLDIGSPLLPPVRFQFEAPPRGASPEQIARGFLAASWSSDDDFRAARAYLTPNASQAWKPRSSVTVYPDSSSLRVNTAESSVELHTVADATLDSEGRYTALPVGAIRRSTLTLSQVSGEWRISNIPPGFGLWLSRFYFERAYRRVNIAYVDPRLTSIVADPRWFPVGAGLATTLARAQLQQPPAYLRGAVRSGFPPGTRLAVDSVPIDGGRAEIDLSPAVLDVSAEERRAAWAQSLSTIRQVPDVSTVALRVSGTILDVVSSGPSGMLPHTPGDLGYSEAAAGSEWAILRTGTRLRAVDAADVPGHEPGSGKAPRTKLPEIATGWSWLGASADLTDLAAVGGDRRELHRWRSGQERTIPGVGTGLTCPAYDVRGTLWVGGLDAKGTARVLVLDSGSGLEAPPRAVTAPWLGGRTIETVRPAPDGQRLLVVTRGRTGVQIGVSGIVRDAAGVPQALTEPWAIGGDVQEASYAAWASNGTVAVIGRRSGGSTALPLLLAVGGQTTSLAAVPDPRRILATRGERGLIVVSGNGQAFGRVGGGWQELGEIDDIVVPGS
ncbi:MAG: LpqB family beta-propeller domain-containing protein [Micrococcales bacterium]|nr:LpqB family beta-propeller domain-containing protein [Micrococcales bacterium]